MLELVCGLLIKIGTSGYNYFWNQGKPTPFEWYLKLGFNSVEINASFYRFPSSSWMKVWSKAPKDFTFSIKVHRSITHFAKLKGKALELWKRFEEQFKPIEDRIEFWLYQLPPNYTCKPTNLETLENFFGRLGLEGKAVVEFRDPAWWRAVKEVEKTGAIFCSVDAPDLPRDIIPSKDIIYLRLHGRRKWYNYVYSPYELDEIVIRMKESKAKRMAIYLNNDQGMLQNGLYLVKQLLGG